MDASIARQHSPTMLCSYVPPIVSTIDMSGSKAVYFAMDIGLWCKTNVARTSEENEQSILICSCFLLVDLLRRCLYDLRRLLEKNKKKKTKKKKTCFHFFPSYVNDHLQKSCIWLSIEVLNFKNTALHFFYLDGNFGKYL